MENGGSEISAKRMKLAMESNPDEIGGEAVEEVIEGDTLGSEEIELRVNAILERIEQFTQQVSEMLEAGKTLFHDLSNQFEERMINIHKEHMEKWQEEIKELRLLDASNEEANALLQNARQLLHNVQG